VTTLGPWELVGREARLPFFADEGLTTVVGPDGRGRLRYRGGWSVPISLRLGGKWDHIGDPGSSHGLLVDCYQGRPGTKAKMFRAEGPGAPRRDYLHPLVAGEKLNNSFAAISPDGQWMVSAEWGTMSRFLVFPTPVLNPLASTSELRLAATLELDHRVRNVQGATFVGPSTLLCSTDDPGTELWPVPRQLLQVELDRPLDGGLAHGRVSCLGALPLQSRCSGTFEVEGMDYDQTTGELRVIVIPPRPCKWLAVTVFRFRRRTAS
jgi:hypothetical protein